jgi:hypothetical protein
MRLVRVTTATAAVLVLAAGCGGKGSYAKVSGVVKLDGKPYPNAVVMFQPIGDEDHPYPGRGSSGITDDQGRFTLKTDQNVGGAIVGKHRVHIQSHRGNPTGEVDPRYGSPDGTPSTQRSRTEHDPIPPEWVGGSHEFEVPSGGTDQANFDIVSVKK